MTPPSLPAGGSAPRSTFVTLFAWVMMFIGFIGLPVSFISSLMIFAHSYGTNTSDPMGFIIVVLGPALVLFTGFGMLRRWWWARGATMALLAVLIASNAWDLVKGPRAEMTTYDATGVPTTVLGSGANFSALPIIAVCAGLLVMLLSRRVRAEFATPPALALVSQLKLAIRRRYWRVGHSGRDMMYYEEKVNGKWEHLDISGEMLVGRAHHVIYFECAERWQSYPEWARHRRGEIVARIKSEFCAPDYEYQDEG